MSAGRRDTTEIAAISPQLVPVTVTNSASPVVTVRALTLVSVAAKRYSFHANTQLRTAVIAMPGAARGTITFRNTVAMLAPSTYAASSSSVGMPSMIPFRSQMAKGRLNTQ